MVDRIEEESQRHSAVRGEEISFSDFLRRFEENPVDLAESAHRKIYRMIMQEGYDEPEDEEDPRSYTFFSKELFGIDGVIQEIVEEYFKPAANNMDVRKRMLLMMGPPGSGKSTIANLLKDGLEEFSLTDAGETYAIKECPQHENPLHLIPSTLREEYEEEYGIKIEGELCPMCHFLLNEEYEGSPSRFTIERLVYSQNNRVGIGTFVPSDPKNQDISELVGSVNISELAEYSESDPRAYNFDGALNCANRGVMEFIEVFKAEKEFLNKLITLCEEKVIKSPRFPLISADEVVISHTNETEYNRFMNEPQNEALRRRIKVVKVPYNLELDEEIRIYRKLLDESNIERGSSVHLAPHCLEAAAHYAIMTRLGVKGADTLKTLVKAHNDDEVGDLSEEDIEERLEQEPDNVGMFGLSPTEAIDAISTAAMVEGRDLVFFTDVLKVLKRDTSSHEREVPNVDEEQLENYILSTREAIDEKVKEDVQKAFVVGFEDSAKTLFDNYLDHIQAFNTEETVEDPVTGDEVPPDEDMMRSIEEQIGISEKAKDGFREQIVNQIGTMTINEENFDWTSVPRLKEAIEEKMFNDIKDFIRISTDTTRQDDEAKRRLNDAVHELVTEHGYNERSARKAVDYVGQILS